MINVIIGVGIVGVLTFDYAVFKVASRCSRIEEEMSNKWKSRKKSENSFFKCQKVLILYIE